MKVAVGLECYKCCHDVTSETGRHKSVRVKVGTLDIVPLRESSPQKCSGMAHVLKGSHSFTCTPTRSVRSRNEP